MNGIIRATWKGCLSLAGAAFLTAGCNTLPVMAPSDVSYLPSAETKAYEVEVLSDGIVSKGKSPAPVVVAMQDDSIPASSAEPASSAPATIVTRVSSCESCSSPCTTCSKVKRVKHKGCSSCGSSCGSDCGSDCGSACDSGCGAGRCGGRFNVLDKLHNKLDNVDWEQLHPDHCWLDQYARESRRRVNLPFKQQMINGNRIEQTIWSHYFEKAEGRRHELNAGGKARLQYLTRRRPYVVPTFFLQDSFDAELNQQRAETIRQTATLYSQGDMGWVVNVINSAPVGIFGGEARAEIGDMLDKTYFSTIKVDFQGGGQGGTSGGGQSAGTAGF